MASSLQVTFYMHAKLKVLIMANESDFIKVQKACIDHLGSFRLQDTLVFFIDYILYL